MPVGEHWELSLRTLAARAILAALQGCRRSEAAGACILAIPGLDGLAPGQPGRAADRKAGLAALKPNGRSSRGLRRRGLSAWATWRLPRAGGCGPGGGRGKI